MAAAGKHRARRDPRALRRDPGQARACRCGRPRTSSASMRSGSTGTWASPSTSRPIAAQIARGADGKKIGIFLLHGGSGDYKSMEPMAKLFAEKFGCKAVADDLPRPALSRRSEPRLARRHHPSPTAPCARRSGSRRAHHARPVRGGARHLDAPALRHPHGGARQARHASSTTAWRRGRSPSRRA